MSYRVYVSINGGNNAMTISDNPSVTENDKLKDIITYILMTRKNIILDKFPTNQWIYQWIISSNIDGSLESFFNAFNVAGSRTLKDALLQDRPISDLLPGDYVLAFEGY